MDRIVTEKQEEWFFRVPLHKLDRLQIATIDQVLVGQAGLHARGKLVGVKIIPSPNPILSTYQNLVKTLPLWPHLRGAMVGVPAQMPLADDPRRVAVAP